MSAPVVETLKAELADQPAMPLRPQQIQDWQDEQVRLDAIVTGPPWISGDRGKALQRKRKIDQLLEQQAPRSVTGERANRIKRLADEVVSRVIAPALQPAVHPLRRPVKAIGHVLKVEWGKAVKDATLTWKRAMRALDPMNDDPDFTNIEQFRPQPAGPSGAASFDVDSNHPGNFAMSPQAKANWPAALAEPQNTALGQVQQREARGRREKRPATPAQLAALARAHAARRAKSAAAQGTVLSQSAVEA